jgi:hypothetical protein
MVSYNFERDAKQKEHYKEQMRDDLESDSEEEEEAAVEEAGADTAIPFEALIKHVDVPLRKERDPTAPPPPPSLLSLQLRPEHRQAEAPKISSVSPNRKGITVYAPDTQPIEVFVDSQDTVSTVIIKVRYIYIYIYIYIDT